MSGFNTSGEHETEDYVLGRGILYLAARDTVTGAPLGYRDLGNATEFNLSVEEETLEHKQSRSGLSIIDKEVTISKKVTGSFTLDSINLNNVTIFFSGTEQDEVVQDNTAQAEFVQLAIGDWDKGQWIDLTKGAGGLRIYNLDATKLTVKSAAILLTEDVDYEVDTIMGRIFIKEDAATSFDPSAEPLNITLAITWSFDDSIDQMQALSVTPLAVSLKFIGENPANDGKLREFQVHKTVVRASGDLALIGDEWQTLGFSFTVELDSTQPTGEEFFRITDPTE